VTAYRSNRDTLTEETVVSIDIVNPCKDILLNPFDMDLPETLQYSHDIFNGEALPFTTFTLFIPATSYLQGDGKCGDFHYEMYQVDGSDPETAETTDL
jgi:hypothetical protein